jgi:mycoredoxin
MSYPGICYPDSNKELFVQESLTQPNTERKTIKMYATTWCVDCRMARRWFDNHNIPYEYINIEENEQAAEFVVRINKGARSVPTIVFPDGSILVEPNARQLAAKFSQ